nr:hypothetical protein [Tanacetum cinerariifolium]
NSIMTTLILLVSFFYSLCLIKSRILTNHAMVGASHAAYTDRFHELARNGSIKKNHEKRGNEGEPSKDRNARDENKKTRTGNAFATTECEPINARNATVRTCYECGSTDHIKASCPREFIVTLLYEINEIAFLSLSSCGLGLWLRCRLVPSRYVIFDLEPLSLSFDFVFTSENEAATSSFVPAFEWFPKKSLRSSNAYALDSPYLLVLNTETSQSRQHDMSESDSYYLSD